LRTRQTWKALNEFFIDHFTIKLTGMFNVELNVEYTRLARWTFADGRKGQRAKKYLSKYSEFIKAREEYP